MSNMYIYIINLEDSNNVQKIQMMQYANKNYTNLISGKNSIKKEKTNGTGIIWK